MDLKIIWDRENYQKFLEYLYSLSDLKYKEFHRKLLKDDHIKVIGIRTPILNKIAREISKGDYLSFFKVQTHQYYEEKVIHGLVIGNLKLTQSEALKLIDDFLPLIDNWTVNDIVCSRLKYFKKYPIDYVLLYINSDNPWIIRFGLVLLLDHYIEFENLNFIFDVCDKITNKDYYVQMAEAWLISICYIKFPKETIKYLQNNKLDKFTFNKAISKICDSYRVSKEDKENLKKIKRNL